jgi:uncharacterized membrane protein YagU involved in acid resistance
MNLPVTVRGIIAGCIATVPMTLLLKVWQHSSARRKHAVLPPRQITHRSAKAVGMKLRRNSTTETALTGLAHFGYGAATGSTYAQLIEDRRGTGATTGILFGLGVWAASYLGIMPALRLQPPPEKQSLNKNPLMISAHVVWGGALGLLLKHWPRRFR